MEGMENENAAIGSNTVGGLLPLIFSAVAEAAELEVKDARLRLLPGDLPAGILQPE